MHQKRKKNQILSRTFNEVREDSEVNYLSNAFLVGELDTMLPNVLIRIKGKNLLDGTRSRMQIRIVTTLMKIVMVFQIVMKMNEVSTINF